MESELVYYTHPAGVWGVVLSIWYVTAFVLCAWSMLAVCAVIFKFFAPNPVTDEAPPLIVFVLCLLVLLGGTYFIMENIPISHVEAMMIYSITMLMSLATWAIDAKRKGA